jgi:hypothetical protein
MKTFLSLAVAIAAIVIAPSITMAAPVTFWFAGTVNYTENPGNTLPANIEIGTPFSGRITYDIALVTQTNLSTFAASKVANYYFRPVNGFTFLLQVGGHTVTNREITNLHWSGNIGVYDNHNNSDELFVDIGQNGLVTDGLEDTNSLVNFHVRDNSKTTFVNAGLPTAPPTLAAFPDARVLTWTQYDASDNTRFSFSGDITQISTNELVALNFRPPAQCVSHGRRPSPAACFKVPPTSPPPPTGRPWQIPSCRSAWRIPSRSRPTARDNSSGSNSIEPSLATKNSNDAIKAIRELRFRDSRPPQEIQFVLKREMMTLFQPVLEDSRLMFRATPTVTYVPCRVRLLFEAALLLTNCHLFQLESSGSYEADRPPAGPSVHRLRRQKAADPRKSARRGAGDDQQRFGHGLDPFTVAAGLNR